MNDSPSMPVSRRGLLIEAELEALFRVGQVLGRSLDLEKTLSGLLEVLHHDAGMLRGAVGLLDSDRSVLSITAAYGADPGRVRQAKYEQGEGIFGEVLRSGQMTVVEKIGTDPRFLGRLGLYDALIPFIGAPIKVEGKTVGILAAQPKTGADGLLPERAKFLEMVATLVAQAVRLSRQVDLERKSLTEERDRLRRTVQGQYGFDNIVGRSVPMRRAFDLVRQVAKWDTTVLIRGESGTGKELIASAIHYHSPRAGGPFVRLNCAALPDNLLESELFGHEKGAFTGATTRRQGRFELADGGTLFLDEIGEISAAFQAKLLRVLQEGEFGRVGGSETLKVDVRIIAATNRDLEAEVAEGMFREDLYYRLNVMPIFLPPLRERKEDIPDLAQFLVAKLAKRQGRPLNIDDDAIRALLRYDWPGNVRELENRLERAAIMTSGATIDRDTVAMGQFEPESPTPGLAPSAPSADIDDPDLSERERVVAALEASGWVQAKAARLLNMTPRQIAYRVKTLNIRMKRF